MNSKDIIQKLGSVVEERGCFIVSVTVSKDNDIVFTIEKDSGSVDLEDCEAVNDAFLGIYDRDAEDYSLTVTSAGLDQPFEVERQFRKAIGTMVEVKLRTGKKLVGVLTGADSEGISLRYSQKELPEGKKHKVMVEHEDKFPMEGVNSVAPHVVFNDK